MGSVPDPLIFPPTKSTIMDIKLGQPYPSGSLSNLAPHPFVMDEVEIASMEGFLQALKFKNFEMQKEICKLAGLKAKRSGSKKNWQRTQTLYWKNTEYKRDSDAYQYLLDRAYTALFTTNAKAAKALLATRSATLKHSIGRTKSSETILTRQEFCSRLTNMRRELQTNELVDY
jgi:predicted NAD-dependent protein-ADP-ribosyltransferase YbiA (DUF1768 family)